MKNYQNLVLMALTMIVFGCSSKKEFAPVFRGNIAGLNGGDWINSYTIGKFGGHTGDYCSKIDSVNQYSYGLSKLVNEISPDPIKKVKVSVWVKFENLSKNIKLVVSLHSPKNKNIYWNGHSLNSFVKGINKWVKIDTEDFFPDFDVEGTIIDIYVWNPSKNIAYVDNFEINFLGE